MADSQANVDGDNQASSPKPPVTMRVEAPAEDSCKQDNETNERRDQQEEFTICSPSTRPFLNSTSSNPFSSPSTLRTNILKPPQLSLNNTNNTPKSSSFVLNPSRLSPIVRKIGEENCNENEKRSLINGETPKFVPLIQSDPKPANQITSTSTTAAAAAGASATIGTTIAAVAATQSPPAPSPRTAANQSSFVFGQNLRDRVIVAPMESNNKSNDEPAPSTSLNTNGTSEMLFSSALKNEVKNDTSAAAKETTKSLSESAREYEESRANKRKYEEVEVRTGEEGETNILNINCKLFAFDKSSGSWQERGRGTLRLNDLEDSDGLTHSRLVFRTSGSLRVVLNTKIWAEMTVEKASDKSVRFTALDPNGEIKVFLAMASMDDSRHLLQEVQSRVQKEVTLQKHKKLHTNSASDSGGN